MPQTLNQIKALLEQHGLRPKKRFGQHFLHDANKIKQIVAMARIQPGQVVLEVGPGTGALSVALLEAGAQLVAVEVDRQLAALFRSVAAPFGRAVSLLVTDVLAGKHRINPAVLAALTPGGHRGPLPYKLVSNLPYQAASPLLANLAVSGSPMQQAVVTVQREVADRLTAPPGRKSYGGLSVCVQAIYQVELVASVPPACFWPRPAVDSAIVLLQRRQCPLTDRPGLLSQLTHLLFAQRRKQLRSIRRTQLPGVELPCDLDPTIRPGQLTIEQLVRLGEHAASHCPRVFGSDRHRD